MTLKKEDHFANSSTCVLWMSVSPVEVRKKKEETVLIPISSHEFQLDNAQKKL